jgi:hypothetical protein
MTASHAVADGDKGNTAALSHLFDGKMTDLKRRVGEGTLPPVPVAMALQEIIEGRFVVGGLLKYVGYLKLKAVPRFVVADNFKVGNVVGGRRIDWIGDNFQEHFYGLVEEDVPERIVYIWELVKGSVDAPVIKILDGGVVNNPSTETHLAHTFQMMELGEKGKGRLDGYANFGYKRSPKDGVLWVPRWRVRGGGFGVEAHSSSGPRGWRDGDRVDGG